MILIQKESDDKLTKQIQGQQKNWILKFCCQVLFLPESELF